MTCPICGNDVGSKTDERVVCASCLTDEARDVAPRSMSDRGEQGQAGQQDNSTRAGDGGDQTLCSPVSEEGALRLFASGYLPRLSSLDGLKGQAWTIPSETQPETVYTLCYDPQDRPSVSCSCPGWTYRSYCKHVRFLEFALGLVISSPTIERLRKLSRARNRSRGRRSGDWAAVASAA